LIKRIALRVGLALVLLIGLTSAQLPIAADTIKGAHYSIEFERRDVESARLVGTVIDECWDEVARAVGADSQSAPVRVLIPGTLEEFRRLAGGNDKRWLVGVAVHPGSLIVVKPPRMLVPSLKSIRQTVRHELVHIMLARSSDVGNMPRWLNEGIAMRVGGRTGPKAEWRIAGAVLRRAVIPLDELDRHFPSSHEGASLAYAESLSVVNYIAGAYGEEALLKLIRTLRDHDFDTALGTSLGVDLSTLSEQWIGSVRISPYVVTLLASSFTLWLMTIIAIVAFFRKRGLARRKKRQWELEEVLGDGL
jgi:hypothetical protein